MTLSLSLAASIAAWILVQHVLASEQTLRAAAAEVPARLGDP
jgi:hypothetical protein